jgi:hypothetical protein
MMNGLQHVFEKWEERCKKCIACQGIYFEKETVTAPPQVPTRSNKVSQRTLRTALVHYFTVSHSWTTSILQVSAGGQFDETTRRPGSRRCTFRGNTWLMCTHKWNYCFTLMKMPDTGYSLVTYNTPLAALHKCATINFKGNTSLK